MGRCIIKLDGHYLEWSTVVDAPVTYGMTLDELRAHVREEEGRQGLRALDDRLVRVEARGTSMHGDESADETIAGNRAGAGETCLTKAQIVDFYCVRKGKGRQPKGARWLDDDERWEEAGDG